MKKKVFFVLFISLILLNNTNTIELNENNTYKYENISKKEEQNIISKNEKQDKILNNKYILKKEIQKRKKYHRNLLYIYNKNFSDDDLKLISQNWLIIDSLNKYYKINFT